MSEDLMQSTGEPTDRPPSVVKKRAVAAAITVGALLGGAGAASAVTARVGETPSTTIGGDAAGSADAGNDVDHGQHAQEEPLTGQIADDVTAAALKAVPGATFDRVETDGDGATYEAHLTDADSNDVRVTFDENLAVLDVQQGR